MEARSTLVRTSSGRSGRVSRYRIRPSSFRGLTRLTRCGAARDRNPRRRSTSAPPHSQTPPKLTPKGFPMPILNARCLSLIPASGCGKSEYARGGGNLPTVQRSCRGRIGGHGVRENMAWIGIMCFYEIDGEPRRRRRKRAYPKDEKAATTHSEALFGHPLVPRGLVIHGAVLRGDGAGLQLQIRFTHFVPCSVHIETPAIASWSHGHFMTNRRTCG